MGTERPTGAERGFLERSAAELGTGLGKNRGTGANEEPQMNEVSKIEMLPVDSLKPYKRNARRHGDEDVAAIAESIREFGFNDPIGIWGKDNLIVEGHGRLMAAKELGMDKVPCIRLDHLTDKQRRAYALAHNRTAELSEWDKRLMKFEIADLPEIDFEAMGFEVEIAAPKTSEWFDREELEGDAHEEGNEEYNEFVDKFKAAKTTDDCYTPQLIYDAIADWAVKRYGLSKDSLVRPFYPGGDYQAENYPDGSVVLDNPPFSILAEIVDFYTERGQRFFLFAPGLATLNYINRKGVAALCTYAGITYENGASVTTSFITNLEPENVAALSVPDLYEIIDAANDEVQKALHNAQAKYEYPIELITAAQFGRLSKYGQALTVLRSEGVFVRALDAQKETGKGIYGGGLLLSTRAAAERAAAERAAATTFSLSDREKDIIKELDANEC